MIINLNNTGGAVLVVDRDDKECGGCFELRLQDILATLPNHCFYRC